MELDLQRDIKYFEVIQLHKSMKFEIRLNS